MSSKAVAARGLVKHFVAHRGLGRKAERKVRAVDGISFDIDTRSTLGLVGESGCGKTTVGRLLARLTKPTSGEIYYDIPEDILEELDAETGGSALGKDDHAHYALGTTRAGIRKLRRRVQMVFQDPFASLDPRMLVRDIVAEPLVAQGIMRGQEAAERVAEVLDQVGLSPENMFKFPHEFSGGQRQRIGVARALIAEPRFVVLDEPTSALDVSVQAQTLNLLHEIQRSTGISVLFISHDVSVISHVADRVAVMYSGLIVELADRAELFDNPLHPYTLALLAAVPRLQAGGEEDRFILGGDVPSAERPPPGCRFHPRCPLREELKARGQDVSICHQVEPPLQEKGVDHLVACHFQ